MLILLFHEDDLVMMNAATVLRELSADDWITDLAVVRVREGIRSGAPAAVRLSGGEETDHVLWDALATSTARGRRAALTVASGTLDSESQQFLAEIAAVIVAEAEELGDAAIVETRLFLPEWPESDAGPLDELTEGFFSGRTHNFVALQTDFQRIDDAPTATPLKFADTTRFAAHAALEITTVGQLWRSAPDAGVHLPLATPGVSDVAVRFVRSSTRAVVAATVEPSIEGLAALPLGSGLIAASNPDKIRRCVPSLIPDDFRLESQLQNIASVSDDTRWGRLRAALRQLFPVPESGWRGLFRDLGREIGEDLGEYRGASGSGESAASYPDRQGAEERPVILSDEFRPGAWTDLVRNVLGIADGGGTAGARQAMSDLGDENLVFVEQDVLLDDVLGRTLDEALRGTHPRPSEEAAPTMSAEASRGSPVAAGERATAEAASGSEVETQNNSEIRTEIAGRADDPELLRQRESSGIEDGNEFVEQQANQQWSAAARWSQVKIASESAEQQALQDNAEGDSSNESAGDSGTETPSNPESRREHASEAGADNMDGQSRARRGLLSHVVAEFDGEIDKAKQIRRASEKKRRKVELEEENVAAFEPPPPVRRTVIACLVAAFLLLAGLYLLDDARDFSSVGDLKRLRVVFAVTAFTWLVLLIPLAPRKLGDPRVWQAYLIRRAVVVSVVAALVCIFAGRFVQYVSDVTDVIDVSLVSLMSIVSNLSESTDVIDVIGEGYTHWREELLVLGLALITGLLVGRVGSSDRARQRPTWRAAALAWGGAFLVVGFLAYANMRESQFRRHESVRGFFEQEGDIIRYSAAGVVIFLVLLALFMVTRTVRARPNRRANRALLRSLDEQMEHLDAVMPDLVDLRFNSLGTVAALESILAWEFDRRRALSGGDAIVRDQLLRFGVKTQEVPRLLGREWLYEQYQAAARCYREQSAHSEPPETSRHVSLRSRDLLRRASPDPRWNFARWLRESGNLDSVSTPAGRTPYSPGLDDLDFFAELVGREERGRLPIGRLRPRRAALRDVRMDSALWWPEAVLPPEALHDEHPARNLRTAPILNHGDGSRYQAIRLDISESIMLGDLDWGAQRPTSPGASTPLELPQRESGEQTSGTDPDLL